MNNDSEQPGYFIFSLDTELAWGYYDLDDARSGLFSEDGSRERNAITRVLELCNEFGIKSTWAVVGHLFFRECELCDICPVMEWKGRYRSFEQIYKTNHPLWYGADVIDLLSQQSDLEIAFHGYTHRIFGNGGMDRANARIELEEWLRVAKRRGITPETVIFPRNSVGHLDLFREFGFTSYRGKSELPAQKRNGYFRRYIKHVDHILNISCPPIYNLKELYDDSTGLVDCKPSEHFFGFNRRAELILDSLNLHQLRIKRMVKGVRRAAAEKKVVHIWAHPWEFRTEKDFDKLRYLFEAVQEEVENKQLNSICMMDIVRIVIENIKGKI